MGVRGSDRSRVVGPALLLTASLLALPPVHAAEPYAAAATEDLVHAVRQLTLEAQAAKRSARREQQAELIAQRKALMKAVMRRQPQAALGLSLPRKARQRLAKALQAQVESPAVLEGALEVLAEIRADGAETTHYYLATAPGEHVVLRFTEAPPLLLSGTRVRARGLRLEEEMVVAPSGPSGAAGLEVLAAAAVPAQKVKKTAIILFNLEGRVPAAAPYEPAHARYVTFQSVHSARAYFEEASFNQVTLQGHANMDGDIFGWVTLACDEDLSTAAPSCNTCDTARWATAAQAAVGLNRSNYDFIIHAFPQHEACDWSGLGHIGSAVPAHSWINGGYGVLVVSHELGHNQGLHHANALSCAQAGSRVALSDTCTSEEYADPFDVMGNRGTHHTSIYQKGRAGWLQAVNTQDVTASGLYTIAPMEMATSGVQSLRIPRKVATGGQVQEYIYAEFRQPYGQFDPFNATNPVVKGVSLRLAPAYTTLSRTQLIDATPATVDFMDAALPVNKTLTEPARNISITTKSVSASGAAVEVQIGPVTCVHAPPLLTITPPADPWALPGGALTYQLHVVNQDNDICSDIAVRVTPTLPGGFTQFPPDIAWRLAPGAAATQAVTITAPLNAAPGFHAIGQRAYNEFNPDFSTTMTAPFNIAVPDTEAPLINGVEVEGITTSTALIRWATDEPADGQVEYAPAGAALAETPLAAALATDHQVMLAGLAKATTYFYRVKSRDEAGNLAVSEPGSFTTSATAPNILANGGFEMGKTNWSGWSANKLLISSGTYEGARALHFPFRTGDRIKELTHTREHVVAGRTYQVDAAIKTAMIGSLAAASVELTWFHRNGRVLQTSRFGQTTGTTPWTVRSSGLIQAPAGAAKLRIRLIGEGAQRLIPADVYFDDVRLYEVP